jgi:hypothetical protein
MFPLQTICLFLVGCFVFAAHSKSIEIKPSNSSVLTAHDFSPYYHSHCKKHTDKCVVLELSIDSLSKHNLIHSLESADFLRQEQELLTQHHVMYVVITIQELQKHSGVLLGNSSRMHEQYEELDGFILERPWWKVQQYPVIFQKQSRGLPLLLEHLPSFLTEASKNLLAVHFPPAEECLKRKMLVRTGSSSWGIDLGNVEDFFNTYPDYIHGFFIPSHGKKVNEGYVEKSKSGCGDKFNLRACTFLETTNCSYPSEFMQFCTSDDCPKSGVYDAVTRKYIGSRDDANAVHRPPAEVLPVFGASTSWKAHTSVAYKTHHPYTVNSATADFTPRFETMGHLDVYRSLWKFGMAYKYNYHLGIRVQEFLQEFYAMYHKPENGEAFGMHEHCVGAHVRKGDRTIPGVDTVQWCNERVRINSKGEREIIGNWIDGHPMSLGNYADMGCGYKMPFGAVHVQHVVNASLLLVNESLFSPAHRLNVLVMTDELPTLEQELEEFQKSGYAREKVRVIPFPTKLKNGKSATMNNNVISR